MICVLGKARLAMGWAVVDRIPVGARFSVSVHVRPWGPCSLSYRSGPGARAASHTDQDLGPVEQPPIQIRPWGSCSLPHRSGPGIYAAASCTDQALGPMQQPPYRSGPGGTCSSLPYRSGPGAHAAASHTIGTGFLSQW
jgi:hypothetical protein